MINLVMRHLKAAQAATADLILTVQISVISLVIFSAICLAAAEDVPAMDR